MATLCTVVGCRLLVYARLRDQKQIELASRDTLGLRTLCTLVMKKRHAPAADESATRGISPPGAPPTSPSTVTSTCLKMINLVY